ncbi:hypothetical protein EJ110_NYTH18676 [Nymphaea thermarum]|nr:hypothetical protein EJ110_NYTH18676 [Nymphaea thermarum]
MSWSNIITKILLFRDGLAMTVIHTAPPRKCLILLAFLFKFSTLMIDYAHCTYTIKFCFVLLIILGIWQEMFGSFVPILQVHKFS